jgi:hypothetical protein
MDFSGSWSAPAGTITMDHKEIASEIPSVCGLENREESSPDALSGTSILAWNGAKRAFVVRMEWA